MQRGRDPHLGRCGWKAGIASADGRPVVGIADCWRKVAVQWLLGPWLVESASVPSGGPAQGAAAKRLRIIAYITGLCRIYAVYSLEVVLVSGPPGVHQTKERISMSKHLRPVLLSSHPGLVRILNNPIH